MMQKIGEMLGGHKEAEAEADAPTVRYRCPSCQGDKFHGPVPYGSVIHVSPMRSGIYPVAGGSTDQIDTDNYRYHCEGCGQWLQLSDLNPEPYTPPK